MSTTRGLIAVVLVASVGVALHAQAPAPPTTAQLLVKIAALELEVARLHGELLIATGRPAVPPTRVDENAVAPVQTLAGASAEAKKISHAWAPSTNLGGTAAPVSSSRILAPAADGTTVPGEAYWRGRMEPLQARQQDDAAALVRLTGRIADLRARAAALVDANRLPDGRATIYGQAAANPAATELVRLQTEHEALAATVVADAAAIAALEEEARHAGALPGWLR
jgi:hypothetical protein